MELKEMILSTLAELEEGVKKEGLQPPVYHKEETYVHVVEETCEQEACEVEEENERAVKAYKKAGFERLGYVQMAKDY